MKQAILTIHVEIA